MKVAKTFVAAGVALGVLTSGAFALGAAMAGTTLSFTSSDNQVEIGSFRFQFDSESMCTSSIACTYERYYIDHPFTNNRPDANVVATLQIPTQAIPSTSNPIGQNFGQTFSVGYDTTLEKWYLQNESPTAYLQVGTTVAVFAMRPHLPLNGVVASPPLQIAK